MKKLTQILLLFSFSVCLAQKEKKETVYLLFDITSKEKCIIEDGSGNSQSLNAYRKVHEGNLVFFHIFSESFAFNTKSKKMETMDSEDIQNLKFVNTKYILDKKSKNVMRYNPFEKIYIVELVSKDKIIKYEVLWIDDWTMIRD